MFIIFISSHIQIYICTSLAGIITSSREFSIWTGASSQDSQEENFDIDVVVVCWYLHGDTEYERVLFVLYHLLDWSSGVSLEGENNFEGWDILTPLFISVRAAFGIIQVTEMVA